MSNAKKRQIVMTAREAAALLRVTCGHKHKAHGLTTVCDLPVNHPGPHRGQR